MVRGYVNFVLLFIYLNKKVECGFLLLTRFYLCSIDSGGSKGEREGRPPGGSNSSNFMQFLGKFGKILCCRPPGVGAPTCGKSWICHRLRTVFHTTRGEEVARFLCIQFLLFLCSCRQICIIRKKITVFYKFGDKFH